MTMPANAEQPGQLARKYQEEIFQQAQKGNVIAYLRTGLGKTLISVLLIRWTCTQEKAKGKAIMFFVPKVSLVEQQANYIKKETGLSTCCLHGSMALDFADRNGWKKRFKEHQVFVITPQLFVEIITHSIWSIDKCSLLIFDECHHTRKNHQYNGIMREYFQVQPSSARPKIFGMTASPYWNQKNPALSLSTLEANLDSKIVGVHEHIEELQKTYTRIHEDVVKYPYPPEQYDTFHSPTIFQCLKAFYANSPQLFDSMDVPWAKVEMRYYSTLSNLGPYCASLFLFLEMQRHFNGLLLKANKIVSTQSQHDAMEIDVDAASMQPSSLPSAEVFDALDLLDAYEPWFATTDSSSDALPIPVSLDWCTPKVQHFVDLLKSHITDSVQAIIFVEQRQTAACLAKILEVIPELQDVVKCGYLLGHNAGSNRYGATKAQAENVQSNPIQLFREKKINVLIATSVAEEGLDFPACQLVIRFDPPQHLVGYVQSRGRARSEVSKYIVMIQQDNLVQLERYKALQKGEGELSQAYHNQSAVVLAGLMEEDEADLMEEDFDLLDQAERERFVVPTTGAILTYDNAMNIVNHLCALIPRDAFTPVPKPRYSGDFQSRLRLPSGLPLSPRDLVYLGYPRHTKKEAKRSAAFQAVKRLLKLNVLNEYLLPTFKHVDTDDGHLVVGGEKRPMPPTIMTVDVKSPWYMGPELWIHPISLGGESDTGLITGTSLPSIDMNIFDTPVSLLPGIRLHLNPDDEPAHRKLMEDFTKFGIWSRISAKPFTGQPSVFVVPLTKQYLPDFVVMREILDNQRGSSDWSRITERDYGRAWVLNWHQYGRTYLLKTVRTDLSPESTPEPGTRQSVFGSTFSDWFVKKWSRKNRPEVVVPPDGPLLEATVLSRNDCSTYDLQNNRATKNEVAEKEAGTFFLPRDCCRYLRFPPSVSKAFEILPVLCRGITDVYRASSAIFGLGLPSIDRRLVVEALTIGNAGLKYSNQRLETLGDAVLQLCTTVHILNRYPNRHEGQLTDVRMALVSNKTLMQCALEIGLEEYVTSESSSVGRWSYVMGDEEVPRRAVRTQYPRRSLQDCMEALLGASYIHGGIPMALHMGTALGVQFGGTLPWDIRYPRDDNDVPATPLFDTLQELLGYKFRANDLLVEAFTHPSFTGSSSGPSYQRLEFLGDAILDLVVVDYLYRKFPQADSHTLSHLRAKVIRAPALAYLGVKKLGLHRVILANNMELLRAIDVFVPVLEAASNEEIVQCGWKYDPPKVMSDVFESLIGAILVDSGYNYERTAVIVEDVMMDVLEELDPASAKDPVSELTEWTAKEGCRKMRFVKKSRSPNDLVGPGVAVEVHGVQVVEPIAASSTLVAKFMAAQRAHGVLTDTASHMALEKLCDCKHSMCEVDETEAMATDADLKMEVDCVEPLAYSIVVGIDQGDD